MDRELKICLHLISKQLSINSYILQKILEKSAKTESDFETLLFIQDLLNSDLKLRKTIYGGGDKDDVP